MIPQHPTLRRLASRLAERSPLLEEQGERGRASVALILHAGADDPGLLLIERARREGDRWSGQIAFPGGRAEGRESPRDTAERETHEELGIELADAQYLGRLDDLSGSAEAILVSAFVYRLDERPALATNHEVARGFWRSFAELCDPGRHVRRSFGYEGHRLDLPAIQVLDEPDAPVLWGLSYRFLELLLHAAERPIPPMPWRDPVA